MNDMEIGMLKDLSIPASTLEMVEDELIKKRFLMPFDFSVDGILSVATSNYMEANNDAAILTDLISNYNDGKVKGLKIYEVTYDNLSSGYNFHYKKTFSPLAAAARVEVSENKEITTEQTKLADNILMKAIELGASDIHITPMRDSTKVQYRINRKLRDAGVTIPAADEKIICNYYIVKAGKDASGMVPVDGRFNYGGTSFRLSTMPYGGDGTRNKVVLRLLSQSTTVKSIDDLGFHAEEIGQLRRLIHKPNGIILICGPTGEGKTTTQNSLLSELNNTNQYVIVTFEDPIEQYIDGIAQSQVRYADDDKVKYDFARGMRSSLRQDPDIILVGEIRDTETATVAVQASQTGHLIFSTLHVRNSISVFRRLADMGVNVSGFAEQIVGVASQRLLSMNCPHCRQEIESPLNHLLRKQDLAMLKDGRLSYRSVGCDKCGHTGFLGCVPIIEIIEFNNYIRDYFSEKHGLIEIEKYLRNNVNFKSLWDKGMDYVKEGTISLEELMSCVEPDNDLSLEEKR